MNCLKYLEKRELGEQIDNLTSKRLILVKKTDGQVCKTCGVIQGNPLMGFYRYYCKHTRNKITKELKKEKEKINKKFDRVVSLIMDSGI